MCVFGYKGHLLFTLVFVIVALALGVQFTLYTFGLVMFGSLLPDIDHQHSMLGRFNFLARTRLMKHRGKCHTFMGSLMLSAPFFLLGGLVGFLCTFAGCISHLLADKLYSYGKHKQAFTLRLW